MACRGLCSNPDFIAEYQVLVKFSWRKTMPYSNGYSRCQECELFMKYNDKICPCCKWTLRRSPRSKKYRDRLKANKQPQEVINVK